MNIAEWRYSANVILATSQNCTKNIITKYVYIDVYCIVVLFSNTRGGLRN